MTFSACSISLTTTVKKCCGALTAVARKWWCVGGNFEEIKYVGEQPGIQHCRCVNYVCINVELKTISRLHPWFQFTRPTPAPPSCLCLCRNILSCRKVPCHRVNKHHGKKRCLYLWVPGRPLAWILMILTDIMLGNNKALCRKTDVAVKI